MGEGHVTAIKVRDMLGLADRARIFDLAESLFRGDVAAALEGLSCLHRDGAESVEVISDLAEAVHAIARVKAVGEEPAGEGLTAEEKKRCTALAERLSMPYLSRAWQMLLKGFEETSRAPNPRITAEMVLIRLAYTADLPTPDELIRTLGGGAVPVRRGAPSCARTTAVAARTPVNAAPAAPRAESPEDDASDGFDFSDDDVLEDDDVAGASEEAAVLPPAAIAARSDPRSFADVVALVSEKRDAKLKFHLEDHVSLVKFDAALRVRSIFFCCPVRRRNSRTICAKSSTPGQPGRWVVVLSKEAGAPAIGAVRRAREAAELESLKAHPAVRAVLEAFPDAKIAEVRRIAGHEIEADDSDGDNESEAGLKSARLSEAA